MCFSETEWYKVNCSVYFAALTSIGELYCCNRRNSPSLICIIYVVKNQRGQEDWKKRFFMWEFGEQKVWIIFKNLKIYSHCCKVEKSLIGMKSIIKILLKSNRKLKSGKHALKWLTPITKSRCNILPSYQVVTSS